MHALGCRLIVPATVALAAVALAACAGAATPTRSATPPEQPAREDLASVALPTPAGPHPIASTTLHLVDRSRVDPLAQDGEWRELMVQLWYPAAAADADPVPYMGAATAAQIEALFSLPGGTFGAMPTHAAASSRVAAGRHPPLILSHGLGTMRAFHTALAEQLASEGYVVAVVDHTHDAVFVEFPDGRLIPGSAPAIPSTAERRKLLRTRVADIGFVLDELTRLAKAPAGLLSAHLDLGRIGALGHSFGGAAAAEAMLADSRIRAGADLDGKIRGRVASRGFDRPFMLMIGDTFGGELTPDQARFVSRLRGEHYALHVVGAGHFSFTDLPLFSSALAGLGELFEIGTIDPEQAARAIGAYVLAFFDTTLMGKPDPLLSGASPSYPDVRFIEVADGAST
jgi:predicted dienelactone hydrolase